MLAQEASHRHHCPRTGELRTVSRPGALREVHAVGRVVTDASVLNDHAVGVEHLAGVIVAHQAALRHSTHVSNSGIVTSFYRRIPCTEPPGPGSGTWSARLFARTMIEDDAATLLDRR